MVHRTYIRVYSDGWCTVRYVCIVMDGTPYVYVCIVLDRYIQRSTVIMHTLQYVLIASVNL